MAGSVEGGKAAYETNKQRYGEDWMKRIGALGGRAEVPKGFSLMTYEQRRAAGKRGGEKSRKGKAHETP